MNLSELSAVEAAAAIRDGQCSCEELVQACLDRIDTSETVVGAWEFLDPGYALQQARDADVFRRSGASLGPLHGVPVGVKDIFDTKDMPTADGTVLHEGRTPAFDASAVAALREAGAIILGKTVTTELAVYSPGKTTNPHDATRTPGGSSSGSAAAVAAGMVPLAIGTQTNGSVIRPAAYCGVCGYKPSYGRISRYRVLQQSRLLDQIGVFGRTVEDAALMAQSMMVYDERDSDMHPRARPDLLRFAAQEPPIPPHFAFVRTPSWAQAEQDVQDGLAELVDFLGAQVTEIDLNDLLVDVIDWHRIVMEADLARSFHREYERGRDRLSETLCAMIEGGQRCLAVDYNHAAAQIRELNAAMEEVLLEYDVLLTPAVTGEAPLGLDSTGSPVFCTPWTFCGMPSISLPILQGSHGMPVGVQLVAAREDDARLLRTARWLAGRVDE